MHTDPIWTLDGGAGTLVTIQLNLCAGTIAMHNESRPDLDQILRDIMQFRVSCVPRLTELDAMNRPFLFSRPAVNFASPK